MAQPVDFLVPGRIFLYIGVRLGHIGLRLVIIVITDEIIHRVVREEIFELAGRLGRQGFIR